MKTIQLFLIILAHYILIQATMPMLLSNMKKRYNLNLIMQKHI